MNLASDGLAADSHWCYRDDIAPIWLRNLGSSTATQCSSRITPRNEDVSADLVLLAVERAVPMRH